MLIFAYNFVCIEIVVDFSWPVLRHMRFDSCYINGYNFLHIIYGPHWIQLADWKLNLKCN